MKFLYRYVKPFAGIMLVGLFIKTIGTMSELALPYILSYILDEIVKSDGRISMIVLWGCLMIFFALLALACNVKANRMASKVSRDCTENVRHDLFYRTMTLSGHQIDTFTIPSLESRITTDTYNVQNFINRIQRLGVRAPILLFGGMIVTLVMDSYLALVMFGVLPAIFLVTLFVSRIGVRLYTGVQKAVDNMIRVVREDSQGIRVIKALSKVKKEHQRYDQVNQKLVRAERKAGLVMGSANPIMDLLMNLGIIFVVLLGAYRVMGRQTQPGKIVAFTQYFTMISTALISVTRMFMMYTKFSASAIRIKEVVDAPMGLTPLSEKKYPPINEEGYLVLDDVSFAYPNSKETLQHISFSLPRRSSLGIIGATGSGKTTLINLIMRLYDVDSGAVRIKGRDIRTIPEEELHHIFGIAMQNDFLYSDTIEENISFGRDLPHESVVRAAKIAQADDFIMSFSKGYTYVLNQKATNLSGGQKQRILIARALAADPDILILDDSSSALDYKTDAALRQAIARHHNDATQIIVAQRVSSVKSCDQILVLEEGKILGLGDHEHLMKTCEVYREISESQMGGNFVE